MKSRKAKKKQPVKALACALAFSAVVHTVGIYPKSLDYASRPFRAAASALYESYQSYKLNRERLQLLSIARAQIKKGKLQLGEFMLKANDIDAREAGEKPDLVKARSEYLKYLAAISKEIKSGKRIQEAFPKVLNDMKYYGIPSGRMMDALLDQGGSCEQLSHLSVSLLNDLGYREQSFLRVYGANADGLAHVAPILSEKGKEYDIVAGRISDGKGTKVPAAYLVEAYAKAHGLPFEEFKDPEEHKGKGKSQGFAARSGQELTLPSGKPSGFSYPAAKDSYPGGAPLFAKRAFKPFSDKKAVTANQRNEIAASRNVDSQVGERPNAIRFLGVRSVASAPLDKLDDRSPNPVVELPIEEKATQITTLIEGGKRSLKKKMGPWALAARYATICGLYRELEWNLRLLGMQRLADAAFEQRKKISDKAKVSLKKFLETGDFKPQIDFGWDHPGYLVYLGEDGEEALFKALEKFPRKEWTDTMGLKYRGETLSFLIAARSERGKILKHLARLKPEEKIRLLDALDALEFASPDEPYKAFQIYSVLARQEVKAPQERKQSSAGILNQGESLNVNDLRIRIDDVIERASAKMKYVIISILDKDSKLMNKLKVAEGQTKTIGSSKRPPFDIKADKVPKQFATNPKSTFLKVFSEKGDFNKLKERVEKECKNNGIGKEWQDVIIAASAFKRVLSQPYIMNARKNPDFHLSFYKWLEGKKEYEGIKLQVKGIYRL